MMIKGCDWGSIDGNRKPMFSEAYDAGIRFVIVRGAGVDNKRPFIDPDLARDRDAAQEAGTTFGSYVIIGQGVPVEDVIDAFIQGYGDRRPGELPPTLDIESSAESLEDYEYAYNLLVERYGVVMSYTSKRVWIEQLGNPKSPLLGSGPAWIKIPYPWKARNPPHWESAKLALDPSDLPLPWNALGSPGEWIEQFQGDSIGLPGFSSTVDLDIWLPMVDHTRDGDPRNLWISSLLAKAGVSTIGDFQRQVNLQVDDVLGPKTFAWLTA